MAGGKEGRRACRCGSAARAALAAAARAMHTRVLFGVLMYVTIVLCDRVLNHRVENAAVGRTRVFRLTMYQDLMIIVGIIKMMVVERYTLAGVWERMSRAGQLARLYACASAVLHSALLLDAVADRSRAPQPQPHAPEPLAPLNVTQEQREIFFL